MISTKSGQMSFCITIFHLCCCPAVLRELPFTNEHEPAGVCETCSKSDI